MRILLTGSIVAMSVVLPSLSFSSPAHAVTDKTDLIVGMKTLPLLSEKMTGTAKVAVIYDASNSSSKNEAEEIKAIIEGDFQAPGDIKLIPVLVPLSDLKNIVGSRIAVITSGMESHYDAISKIADSNHILTMSTDLSCVKENKCVLGIVSKPSVDIYYSKSAADAARITFSQVFTLLVKQI